MENKPRQHHLKSLDLRRQERLEDILSVRERYPQGDTTSTTGKPVQVDEMDRNGIYETTKDRERDPKGRWTGDEQSVEARKEEDSSLPLLPGGLWDMAHDSSQRPLPPEPCPTVHVRVVFLKIGEIDTMREQFSADVFLQARWRDPSLDSLTPKSPESENLGSRWNPQIKVLNIMGEETESSWREVTFDREGHAFVLDRRRLHAKFSESLELENFPMDIQHLSLHVASELPETEVVLVEDEEEPSFINVDNFVDAQEWKLRDLVEACPHLSVKEFSSVKHCVPSLLVRCVAFRRAGFFIWNILCVMTLISSLSFCTWTVRPDLPQNRLQLSFTLMLTGVAFKFVATASLPKIPYLTYLDRFVLGSMLFLFLVCLWHAVITRFSDNPALQAELDKWAFFAFLLLYVLTNLTFVFLILVKSYMSKKSVYEAERKYQERLRRSLGDTYATRRRTYARRRRSRILIHSKTQMARAGSKGPDADV